MHRKMEATLKYNLPEEQEEFESAIHGGLLMRAVRSHLERTRRQLKHEIADDNEARIVQMCMDDLIEKLELYGVSNLIHS